MTATATIATPSISTSCSSTTARTDHALTRSSVHRDLWRLDDRVSTSGTDGPGRTSGTGKEEVED